MKRVAALLAFAAAGAHAAVPGLGTSIDVRVVDESDRPVDGAYVIAREFARIAQLHGHRVTCTRGDIASARNGVNEVRLPAAGMDHLAFDRTHSIETAAYAPGYCIVRGTSESISASGQVQLRAVAVPADEARLHHLLRAAQDLACNAWSERSRASVAEVAKAMQLEAQAIARTRYERSLAQRLSAELAQAVALPRADTPVMPTLAPAAQPFVRDFVVLPEGTRVRFPQPGEPNQMVVAAAPTHGTAAVNAVRAAAPLGAGVPPTPRLPQPGILAAAAPTPPRLAIHCRLGEVSACDLDERDPQGRTALAQYAADFNAEAVALLVAAGADPSIASPLAGADAIEAWMRRVLVGTAAAGSPQSSQARAVIDALAASPKARVAASLKADLQADPAQWRYVGSGESRALILHARDVLAAVPARADVTGACEAIQPISGAAPVRLR